MSTNKRIAYWMSDKKRHKVDWGEFTRVCHSYGYDLFPLDIDKPLEDQEPFVVFLHKLTDIIALAFTDIKSYDTIEKIEDYLSSRKDVIVIDPIDKVRQLLNRFDCYTILSKMNMDNHGIYTPNFCKITETHSEGIANQLNNAKISYPFICKPLLGHGSRKAHEMMLVFNEYSLLKCPVPCVAQQFVNHDAVLYKLFIVGSQYYYVQRPSLKNFYPDYDCQPIMFESSYISKAGARNTLNKLDSTDTKNEFIPDTNVFQIIAKSVRNLFEMELLGVDVVITNDSGRYAIIDVNAYPGYDGVPSFYDHLLKCIDAKVEIMKSLSSSDNCNIRNENIKSDRSMIAVSRV